MIPVVSLFLISAQSTPEPILGAPALEWVAYRATYGTDITLDGKVWVNTNRTGARDDYVILANDLYKALVVHDPQPRVWVRGYHLRNKSVSYRETKQLIWIDCKRDTIWIERKLFCSASGDLIASTGPFASEPVIPAASVSPGAKRCV